MSSWPWRRQSLRCGTLALLLAAAGCGGSGSSDPPTPAEITLNSADITLAAAGQSQQLVATVLDQDGDPIPDATVQWTASEPTVVAVSTAGLLTAQGPGDAQVTATAGEAVATAEVVVQSTASVEIADGNGQTAAPSTAVPTAPAVLVRDGGSNPVPGVRVLFTVGTASGSVTGESQITGADGIARVGSWRLGSSGINILTAAIEGVEIAGEPVEFIATTADPSGYNITVRYLTDISNPQLLAFAGAELRWESLVTGDLADVNLDIPVPNPCDLPGAPGPFDDLTIFVSIEPIDGPFGVLGQAGPCFVRVAPGDPSDGLTVIGKMQFDEDDMELLETEGSLGAVILHEMGHVLGFGTLWDDAGLLVDAADPDTPAEEDPHFTGAQALAAFEAAGGGPYPGAKVPVMDVGGEGTINSHWRDEVFDPEVMTGFLSDGVNPLSAISVRSLADLGYTVNDAGADDFTLDLTPIRIAGQRRGRQLVNDIIKAPIQQITLDGRVVGVIRR
ncbi:MAG: leishmanolysin-related zinc metalloendopeptidase [Gemmatimonadales bacterium]